MSHFDRSNFPLRNSVGHLIHLANQYKDRVLDSHLAPYDITAAQFKVLLLLARDQTDTPAELSRCLSLDSGAMTRMLDRLEAKGLLRRVRSLSDRRQVRLELTEQGQALSSELMQIGVDALNDLTHCLDRQELDDLERLLRRLLSPSGLLPENSGDL
ncbi:MULTISPECIES: MarR family transcriptional regulator [Pseudomonas]|uniref:MarR family transcriptional regulator n=1 Tax=Pseudomonas TaxID=286 RepID=UPI00104E41F5|nr:MULTISPECIES: MarR family transcriptional regulator [Pseudomonas]MBA1213434.1 MarR family transcriptional regulator [Pseudomonas psychrotolerans]TCQ85951.1 DNA-binding MarR family transcriptional regulator [Pseudomonas sp. JUb52]